MSLRESRGSLPKQLAELFKQSLKAMGLTKDDLHDLQPPVVRCFFFYEFGDYECNPISLFRKIKTGRPEFTSTGMVAEAIKEHLPKSEMIGKCCVKSERVIVFLSRKWLAKEIEKMLIEGIQSWAPRLPVMRAVLHSTKPTHGDLKHNGRFRSTTISDSLTKILEFSGVVVLRRHDVVGSNKQGGEPMSPKAPDQISDTSFENNPCKHLKVCNPDIPRFSDGLTNKAFEHLQIIRHYLEKEEADWIIFVADDDLREYIRDLFQFAKVLGWHSGEYGAYPKVTHAGYRMLIPDWELSHPPDSSADLFDKVKNKARKAFEEKDKDKKWSEQKLDVFAEGALRYFILNWDRDRNHEFTFDVIHDDTKEDSGVSILHHYDSICSIMRTLGDNEDFKQLVDEDIEHLKKGGELVLDYEDERRLAVRLLEFSEIVEEACSSLRPEIICEHLFNLALEAKHGVYSKRRIIPPIPKRSPPPEGKRNLRLLLEATIVVMHKCFELLGITLVDSPLSNQ